MPAGRSERKLKSLVICFEAYFNLVIRSVQVLIVPLNTYFSFAGTLFRHTYLPLTGSLLRAALVGLIGRLSLLPLATSKKLPVDLDVIAVALHEAVIVVTLRHGVQHLERCQLGGLEQRLGVLAGYDLVF